MRVKLKDCKIGSKIRIVGYEGKNQQYRQRLLSMGLIKGVVMEVTKKAPLGDPIELLVRGYKLSLRKLEAEELIMESCDE